MRTVIRAAIAVVVLAPLVMQSRPPSAQAPSFDLIVRNGRIIDGTGSAWYRADIGVRGDTIARIATRIDPASAGRVIDAAGKVVAPGFIDIHSHARRGILDVPTAENYMRQGVTTIIEGPDGSSPLPIKPHLDEVAAKRVTTNYGLFVGQGSIREQVMGPIDRKATPEELEKMRGLVRDGMKDGAFGLSSGLFYVPGTFTPTAEVIELAKVAGQMGGIYISHMRDEASHVLDSVKETIEIGEKGGLPTQVTHHKIIGKANWGRSVDTLKLVDDARARGVDATIDQYPYTASSTSIQAALMPAWAQEGGRQSVLKRLQNPSSRNELRNETARLIRDERGGGDPNNVQLARCSWNTSLDGKRLGEVTKIHGLEPTIENAAETALWIVEQGGCSGIFHAIEEQDLQRILKHPATMVASDGGIPIFGEGSPHPRNYGTFSRVLGRYVRELKTITLEDAIRKMSSYPAQRINLSDRGVLREGLRADIAVFDPLTVADKATFENPHQYSVGMSYVIVNGQVVLDDGKMTAARPGRILYGPAAPKLGATR